MNDWSALEASLLKSAPLADRYGGDLGDELARLYEAGFALAPLPVKLGGRGWACDVSRLSEAFDALRMLGRANLSLGRLFEGHLNAVKLVEVYGTADQLEELATSIANGSWLGVWGADGAIAVTCDDGILCGNKRFASGLGMINRVLVTVGSGADCQLYLAPCDDPVRADTSIWKVSGMRATQSGEYDFDGIAAEPLGRRGEYQQEPWFEGGVWRYCAVHCGGAEALRDEVATAIEMRDQQSAPRQRDRIARIAMLSETMRLWIYEAALRVEGKGGGDPAAKAAYALLAREQTELTCLEVMTLANRALGTAAYVEGSRADRVRRDLGLFLRQADIDGKLERATNALLSANGNAELL